MLKDASAVTLLLFSIITFVQFLIVKNTQVTDVQLVMLDFFWPIETVIPKILTVIHMILLTISQSAQNVLINTTSSRMNANLLKKGVSMTQMEIVSADLPL